MTQAFNLTDGWNGQKGFSWRRPNSDSFSRIDRFFFSQNSLQLTDFRTNWALSLSDHAALEFSLTAIDSKERRGTRIPRIDPTLFSDPTTKELILEELEALFGMSPADWNPHLKLEYLKMSIRTICEKFQADRKRKELNEEELTNLELDIAIKSLEDDGISVERRQELINYVEELRGEKARLIEKKGERLALKLGTKWYNEGEKSTRYFLRLLNRKNPDKFKQIQNEAGDMLTSQLDIEAEIVNFYKNLYKTYDRTQINLTNDDEFFDELEEISGEAQASVVAPITTEDLAKTLSSCKDSAPGPDGIPYSVWRATWRISGPIITNAWNHSMVTGKLPPSHRVSFLKLIPKIGKDPSKLTNWRPITLSNCDHKIITKTFSNRLCEKVADHISTNQAAYLKGRMIQDNIRALIASVQVAASEDNIDALLISLDAKKAFDSVEHDYIKKCLAKFGLQSFVKIFRILYNELRSDIVINSNVVEGFKIKRGVKQGDALSCILFIMCMEPLIRNIEKNPNITHVNSELLEAEIPKVAAYADDVSCLTLNNPNCVQEIFWEYSRLTRLSGLELNADKTEILPITSKNIRRDPNGSINVAYANKNFNLTFSDEVKINGVLFQNNLQAMKDSNVARVVERIDQQFKKWSQRNLSTLGKILIVKTFGISQIIYLLQCMVIDDKHFKAVNAILYKFIWNRHYLAAKAPERISRLIVNKPIKLGGLGMLDVSELDEGLKLRAVARLLETKHPFLALIKDRIDLDDPLHPKSKTKLDEIAVKGINLLRLDRLRILANPKANRNITILSIVKGASIKNSLNDFGLQSLAFLTLRTRGRQKIGELTDSELRSIERFIDKNLFETASFCIRLNLPQVNVNQGWYFAGGKIVDIAKLSSKDLRTSRSNLAPLCNFKIGPTLTQSEAINWGNKISKLACTRHKDIILRLMHGELYSKERLFKYGLTPDQSCPKSGQQETLKHKYIECPYVKELWRRTFELTDQLRVNRNPLECTLDRALCIKEPNKTSLTVHAEILGRIRSFKDEQVTMLTLPKLIVQLAIRNLIKKELNAEIKTELTNLLE